MHRISLLFFILLATSSVAQQTTLSPYSRFGIGDPESGSFVSQFGMAGTGIAVVDGIHINPLNPAAASMLKSPSFEFGLKSDQLKVTSSDAESNNSVTKLNHFSVGFPMWKGKWGATFGLSPYSSIGYNNSQATYSEALDTTYTAEYIGSGGLNKINLDLSRKLTLSKDTSKFRQNNTLSLGLGLNYLFGSVSSERNSVFPLNSGFLSTGIEDATTMNDVSLTGGVLARYYLSRQSAENDFKFTVLNLGLTFASANDLRARRSREVYSYTQNASGVEFSKDSILSFEDQRGFVSLPSNLAAGASVEFYWSKPKLINIQRKLTLALDYKTTDWTSLSENFGTEINYDGLGTQNGISAGLMYQPDAAVSFGTRGGMFRYASYRLGYRSGDSFLHIDNQAIKESGMSFGMSLPLLVKGVKETDTQFDIGVEYGNRGTTDSGLLKEEFFRVMIGFSFHPDPRFDQWFRKRKYD